jgi:xanthine dehydrogenase accessory factor
MNQTILEELLEARARGLECVLVTVAATKGSIPRQAGTKMLVYTSGKISGTVGGGKFEALVIEDSLTALQAGQPELKTYVLREGSPDSFGAICGGEVTVLLEPQNRTETVYLFGAGHCAMAIGRLARTCGFRTVLIEDRPEIVESFEPADQKTTVAKPAQWIGEQSWQLTDALILVNRNYQLDRDALEAALKAGGCGYIGMMGSKRKVRRVYDELKQRGMDPQAFARVHAPIGLEIGADSPEEIAVSVIAEVLAVLRGRSGESIRIGREATAFPSTEGAPLAAPGNCP